MDSSKKQRFTNRLIVAALAGATAIAIGAFGAHGLEGRLQNLELPADLIARRLAQFDTGARYHLAHSIVLLVLALHSAEGESGWARKWKLAVFSLMCLGILLFSGSLYVLVLTNTPWLGAITPIGGASWVAAWLMLAGLVRR